MKTFKQFLFEGRDAALFHGTSVILAKQICSKNLLDGETFQFDVEGRKFWGNSFTRDPKFAKQWALKDGVVFQVSQRKLTHNFKIVPVDAFPESDDRGRGATEAEEFVKGPIKNFMKYVEVIYVPQKVLDDKSYSEWKNTGKITFKSLDQLK